MNGVRQVQLAVVGAGAAGLSAARVAAEAGLSVVVLDSYHSPGGQYYRQPATTDVTPSPTQRRGRELAERSRRAGVEIIGAATVWDARPGRLEVTTNDGLSTIVCGAIVVASGAYERSAAFPGWTLPGVYTAGALQTLLKAHHVVPGERVLFVGSGPLQLVVAAALARNGTAVEGVYEASRVGRRTIAAPLTNAIAMWRQVSKINEAISSMAVLLRHGVRARTGWGIVQVVGTTEVTGAIVGKLDGDWNLIAGTEHSVDCDTVAVHYGLVPSTELLRLLGVGVHHQPEVGGWVPRIDDGMATDVAGVFAAGDCTGIGGVGMSLVEGEIAGISAAAYITGVPRCASRELMIRHRRERRFQAMYGSMFTPGAGIDSMATDETLVCRCESVTAGTLDAARARGATSPANAKSITRVGMGACQGRVCGPIVAGRLGYAAESSTPFTARPPLVPIPFAAVVGQDRP
jgi:thioredoxin reductase